MLIRTFLPEGYSNEIINSIWHRKCFSISGSSEWYRPTSSYCSTQRSMHMSATRHLYCEHTHKFDAIVTRVQHTDAATHTCKSSVSRSRAVRFVLQVPWHKPSSQEANHIKSMSHVAAYTGSEALRGVMLDIVLHPHTVTQIPNLSCFFGRFWLQISACNYITHLKL